MAEVIHPERLIFLADLRKGKDANYTHRDMARHFGLHRKYSYQTVGQWERGQTIPPAEYRALFIEYLWHILGLRRRPSEFEEKWQLLVEEWQWAPLDPAERRKLKLAPVEEPDVPANTLVLANPAPMQAPTYPAHFVGRIQEMAACIALLPATTVNGDSTPAAPVMLALVGMGGIGKTTWATHIAHQLRGEFRDGVLWGRVATDHVLDILQSWAQAYDHDFSTIASVESRAAAVRNLMQGKQALIILDDVTTLTKGAQLLPATADCAVLLTTRNLDIANALHAQPVLLGELNAAESVKLLIATIGNERVQAELDAASAICKTLQCLPLAVELVAQRLASRPRQSLAATAALLQDAGYRLDLGISDRAVRTSFLVSWDALTVKQQRLFALMGVFSGRAFTAQGLAYVAALAATVTEGMLMDMVALSLVQEQGERYQQHPLLADFAQEQLNQESAPYQRMAMYYAAFAKQYREHPAEFKHEWSNLAAAIHAAYAGEMWALVIEFTESLNHAWMTLSRYDDARAAYQLAAAAVKHVDDDALRAPVLLRWGAVCIEQNEYDEAKTLLTTALHLAYQIEQEESIADAQYYLGRIATERNQYQEARQAFAECEEIRQTLGDAAKLAALYVSQGWLHFTDGMNLDQAEHLGVKALANQRTTVEPLQRVPTLQLLAQVAAAKLEFQTALAYAEEARGICEAVQSPSELATSLYILTIIHRKQEDYQKAAPLAEQSLTLFRRLGIRRLEGMVLHQMSIMAFKTGDTRQALSLIEQSRHIFSQLQDQLGHVYALRHIGDIYRALYELPQAHTAWREAQQIALALGDDVLLQSIQQRLTDSAAVP